MTCVSRSGRRSVVKVVDFHTAKVRSSPNIVRMASGRASGPKLLPHTRKVHFTRCKGRAQVFYWGKTGKLEAESGGGVLGEGAATPPH